MSDLLHFAEHTLQEIALITMTVVYTLRLRWLFKFKRGRERQAPTGAPDTTPKRGFLYSWATVAMPWSMESSRTRIVFYIQFILFHLGVIFAITLSFIIPYAPSFLILYSFIIPLFQVVIGTACMVGVIRIVRRVNNKYLRAISSPDDYFSLFLMTVWFGFAFFAVPNPYEQGEGILLTYFILTAFFLIYVPFSKISHYLYYPFTRYWFGKSMGHRGVYPMKHVSKKGGVQYGN
ncbi:hypothetical protein ACFLS9_08445 [Bacteroidota bacterium]